MRTPELSAAGRAPVPRHGGKRQQSQLELFFQPAPFSQPAPAHSPAPLTPCTCTFFAPGSLFQPLESAWLPGEAARDASGMSHPTALPVDSGFQARGWRGARMVWGSLWMPSIPDSPFPWGFWPSGWKRRRSGAPKGVLRGCWDIPAAAAWGLSLLLLIPVGASRWPGALGARGPGVSTASGQRPQRVTSAAPAPGEDVGRSGPSARPGRGNPSEKRWNPSRSRHREAAEGAGAAAPGDLGDPQAATSVGIREKSSSESRPSGRIPFFTRSPCLSLRFPAGIFSRDL